MENRKPWVRLLVFVGASILCSPNPWAQSSPPAEARRKKVVLADLVDELAAMKESFETRFKELDTSENERSTLEEKKQAAALAELEKQFAAQLGSLQKAHAEEVVILKKEIAQVAAREEARAQAVPPSVEVQSRGVSLGGFIQADVQLRQSSESQHAPNSGALFNEDRFMIPRARLALQFHQANARGWFEVDGNTLLGPTLRLVHAEVATHFSGAVTSEVPLVEGALGLFRIPFGREVLQSDQVRLFSERSWVVRALFPGEYDLGAKISGGWRFLRYALAAQNGEPLGTRSYPGRDPNRAKDIVGRIGISSPLGDFSRIVAGASALRGWGYHPGALATKDTITWVDKDENGVVGGTGEVTGIPGNPGEPSADFGRFAVGMDCDLEFSIFSFGKTLFSVEGILAENLDRGVLPADPLSSSIKRDYRELGGYVSVAQTYGPWVLAARLDYYDPDQDANSRSKGSPVSTDASYTTLSGVLGYRKPRGRILLEFDYNRNHLGLDVRGMPSNWEDSAVKLRGEVSF